MLERCSICRILSVVFVLPIVFAGCGNLSEQTSTVVNNQPNTTRDQLLTLVSKGTGPNGADEYHTVMVSSSFDPVAGQGNVSIYGDTVVVSQMSGNFSHQPPWFDEYQGNDTGSGWVNISLSGDFVPADGQLTNEMAKLLGLSLGLNGNDGLNEFKDSKPIPGCDGTVHFSPITGELCPSDYPQPTYAVNWNCWSTFNKDDQSDTGYWSYTSCSVSVNGGTINNLSVNVSETTGADSTDPKKDNPAFQLNVNFGIVITEDYEQPMYPVPTTPGDGSGGKG